VGGAQAARSGESGYSDVDRQAAVAMYSHQRSSRVIPTIGRVLSHNAYLVITRRPTSISPDELSPLGVRNDLRASASISTRLG